MYLYGGYMHASSTYVLVTGHLLRVGSVVSHVHLGIQLKLSGLVVSALIHGTIL